MGRGRCSVGHFLPLTWRLGRCHKSHAIFQRKNAINVKIGWWLSFKPFEKYYCSQIGLFSQVRMKIYVKRLKPSPRKEMSFSKTSIFEVPSLVWGGGNTGVIIWHQPKLHALVKGRILQIYDTFALFDFPKMDSSMMIPEKESHKRRGWEAPISWETPRYEQYEQNRLKRIPFHYTLVKTEIPEEAILILTIETSRIIPPKKKTTTVLFADNLNQSMELVWKQYLLR